jgi:hypothetical protein
VPGTEDLKFGTEGAALVQWTATNQDNQQLSVKIDYSIDNGNTWKPVYSGPNRGRVVLSNRVLPSSSNAICRVRVSDGFNETQLASKAFEAPGTPPLVVILNPQDKFRVAQGSSVNLACGAHDDRRARINLSNIKWSINGQVIGEGDIIDTKELKIGENRILVEATDSQGRISRATVVGVVFPREHKPVDKF